MIVADGKFLLDNVHTVENRLGRVGFTVVRDGFVPDVDAVRAERSHVEVRGPLIGSFPFDRSGAV